MGCVACGGSILVVRAGGGLGGNHGGTVGGTLGGAWGSVLRCSMGSCIVAWVRLEGGVGVGGCAPVASKISASRRMASMVRDPKRAKGGAGAGFARSSARSLAASVSTSAEEIPGMSLLWGKTVLFW